MSDKAYKPVFYRDTLRLKAALDVLYQDVEEVIVPSIIPRPDLDDIVRPQTGKEVYRIKTDQILRYDLTNVLLRCRNLPDRTRCFGPVYRDGPTSGMRWKEFLQYDVDTDYKTYGFIYLRRALKFLSEKIRGLRLEVNEEPGGLESPVPISLSPGLIRDHRYYRGFVFELYEASCREALLAGGIYEREGVPFIGFSFGISRLVALFERKGLKVLPLEKAVICYILKGTPSCLIERFRNSRVRLLPVPARKNLYKDTPGILRRFKDYEIIGTIVYGQRELVSGRYHYRDRSGVAHSFTQDQLQAYFDGCSR